MWAREAKKAEEMENRWTVVMSKISPCRHHTNVHSDTLSTYTHVHFPLMRLINSYRTCRGSIPAYCPCLAFPSLSISCGYCLSGLQWPFWIMDGLSLLVTVTKTTIPLSFYISLKRIILLSLGLLLSHFPFCSLSFSFSLTYLVYPIQCKSTMIYKKKHLT